VAIAFISKGKYTNNAYFSILQTKQNCYVSQKSYTLAGFEPGSSVLEADAMPIAISLSFE
jgi:hypothetical protein